MRSLMILALTATPALAQTAEPSATTATYGNWTVTCAVQPDPVGKVCQMTTKLNLKASDGQVRPLIEVAIGQPADGSGVRIVVQVPMDVALRDPVVISVDQDPASGDAQTQKPQTELVQASYFACVPSGCIADAPLDGAAMAALQGAATTNMTFTALGAPKKITVPVAMAGFGDALAALGLPAK